MLLVRTTLGPSPIHGFGVFAAEPIVAGTAVWRFTPGFDLECDPSQLDRVTPSQRQALQHYGYVDSATGRYVLCCDDARFLNHSTEPSLVNVPDGSPHGADLAARDIAVGEELTVDYRSFDFR